MRTTKFIPTNVENGMNENEYLHSARDEFDGFQWHIFAKDITKIGQIHLIICEDNNSTSSYSTTDAHIFYTELNLLIIMTFYTGQFPPRENIKPI